MPTVDYKVNQRKFCNILLLICNENFVIKHESFNKSHKETSQIR